MDKKLARLLEPRRRLLFVTLATFSVISFLYSWQIGLTELMTLAVLALYFSQTGAKRRRDIYRYVENLTSYVDSATKDTVVKFPMPMIILNINTLEVIWCNERFITETGLSSSLINAHISGIIPEFEIKWLLEGKNEYPGEALIKGKRYRLYGNVVKSGHDSFGILATLFFVDMTETYGLKEDLKNSRTVVSIITIDSYEELFKNTDDSEKSAMLAMIDSRINEWIGGRECVLRKYDRDKYLFIFESKHLDEFKSANFSVLERVRELKNREDIPATLSIGIGEGMVGLGEKYTAARLAIEMALSRGGDQVVIKRKDNFEFYGGETRGIEKRTKVKARVMANAFSQFAGTSSQIFIMGHRYSDIDCIGAACGVVAIARKINKKVRIVVDLKETLAMSLINRLRQAPEYSDIFISPDTALVEANQNTLLVVVDTNRPDYVESPALLSAVRNIAVIDHHRRAANYIENCVINIHEPYASSTSELVAELLQYLRDTDDILRVEGEGLMAGIFLDTRNFSIKTGVRTFEAAAFLKRIGADTVEVKRLFQNDIENYLLRQRIIEKVKTYKSNTAIAVADFEVNRAIAGQAADELLEISGILCSFVLFLNEGSVTISARSYGQTNVQMIMEKLGGGGNLTTAGAQIKDGSIWDVEKSLKDALNEYLSQKN